VRYWWVNQNQTYRHEVGGGYHWSPKRKANSARNPFYEFMREVSPSDVVFSFSDTLIRAFGVARSYAYEAPKPSEFGAAGRNWEQVGWRIDVEFHEVESPLRPADWIERLRPLLPQKYSPLLPDGRGLQSVYLTVIPDSLAFALADLLGQEITGIVRSADSDELIRFSAQPEIVLWEEHLQNEIEGNRMLAATEKQALILARRGQGRFRDLVSRQETRCRVTRVDRPEHLRASHCKPWRDSTNAERLDPNNGLMLTPSIDHLFDRGFISFDTDGQLLVSPVAHRPSLARMGVTVDREQNVGNFTREQGRFLEFHRDAVFLRANLNQ
jgi:hypothetical protein